MFIDFRDRGRGGEREKEKERETEEEREEHQLVAFQMYCPGQGSNLKPRNRP